MTRITVIIPTCDRPADYLRSAIESVLAQSLPAGEIIVVDNGTRNVDPTELPEGVTLHRLPPKVGPSKARNFGAAMAQGEYLAFLDDDDTWDPTFLQNCWNCLAQEQAECVYGTILEVKGGELMIKFSPKSADLTLEQLLCENPGASGQNILIRKSTFFAIGGFDQDLSISEDRDFAIRMVLAGVRIACCPSAFAIVTAHDKPRLSSMPAKKMLLFLRYHRNLSISSRASVAFVLMRKYLGRLSAPLRGRPVSRGKVQGLL